jgi:hypothetical protein
MSRVIFLLSLGILLYLFYDSFLNIEIAISKNNAFTQIRKQEIDVVQNIDSVKQLGKTHLDTIRRVHRNYSRKALINTGLLIVVILFQIILFRRKQTRT